MSSPEKYELLLVENALQGYVEECLSSEDYEQQRKELDDAWNHIVAFIESKKGGSDDSLLFAV
jgi:hypothetical protein